MLSATTASQLEHGTFTIERLLEAPPTQVFACWSTSQAKLRWFHCEDWGQPDHQLDFRIGGRETNRTGPAGGPIHLYDALYHDIVTDERFVLSYTMWVGDVRISVSLMSVEFIPESGRTRMVFTEQMVVLDERYPVSSREEGTRAGLENLAAEIARQNGR